MCIRDSAGEDPTAHPDGTGSVGGDDALDPAAAPLGADGVSATAAQSAHAPGGPGGRQRRQHVQFAVVALQQHLRDARGGAEVAVDLEGRVQVEHVGREPVRPHQVPDQLVGPGAVLQPRPEVDLPRERPTRPVVTAQLQRPPRGLVQLGCPALGDLVARMQTVQVGDVPVSPLGLHPVGQPLLDVAPGADPRRRQPVPGRQCLSAEAGVHAEDFAGAGDAVEEVAQNLVVHGGPRADGGVRVVSELRRVRRVGDQVSERRVGDQGVEEELGGALQSRIVRAEEVDVTGEQVVVPDQGGQPGATGLPHPPLRSVDDRGAPPRVGVVVRHPAAGAVLRLGHPGAGHGQVVDHVEDRAEALGQVRRVGGPVVHRQVGVDGELRVPGRSHLVVPDALQVRRLGARPRGRDEQIPAELEQQGGELRVVHLRVLCDPYVGRLVGRRRTSQVDRHPVEQRLIVGEMPAAQSVDADVAGSVEAAARDPLVVAVDLPEVDVAGADRHRHRHAGGA